ncbi:hypothetical protein [Oceanobacillus sp. CAU 1775]
MALLVIILAATNFFLETMDLTAIYLLLACLLLIVLGAEELQKNGKALGYPLIIIGVFNFIVLLINLLVS